MAISSPLLEASIDGAHGVLLSIQGGSDLGLFEINEAAQLVSNSAAPDANFIFGAVIDDALGDEVRVTVIAAGLGDPRAQAVRPETARVLSGRRDTNGHGAVSLGGSTGGTFSREYSQPAAPATPAPATSAPAQAEPAWQAAESAAPEATLSAEDTRPPAGGMLAAPVPADAMETAVDAGQAGVSDESASAQDGPSDASPESDTQPEHAASPGRLDPVAAARIFGAASSPRRPLVFEEDDELDVPDFLK
jgi:cell division protein FtsZ